MISTWRPVVTLASQQLEVNCLCARKGVHDVILARRRRHTHCSHTGCGGKREQTEQSCRVKARFRSLCARISKWGCCGPRRWSWGRGINLHKVINFLFLFFFLNSRKKTTRQFVRIHTIQSSKNRLDPGLDFRTWLKEHYAVLEKPYLIFFHRQAVLREKHCQKKRWRGPPRRNKAKTRRNCVVLNCRFVHLAYLVTKTKSVCLSGHKKIN